MAELEGALWEEAQSLVTGQHGNLQHNPAWQSSEHTKVCFIDGAWKEEDIYTSQGWFCRTDRNYDGSDESST